MYCNECVRIGDDMMEKYNMDRTQKLVRISEVPGRHKMTVEVRTVMVVVVSRCSPLVLWNHVTLYLLVSSV